MNYLFSNTYNPSHMQEQIHQTPLQFLLKTKKDIFSMFLIVVIFQWTQSNVIDDDRVQQ
jgi:hypothetical protein